MFDNVQANPPARAGDDRERRPPVPVCVDLAAAFAAPQAQDGVLPDGWDMTATVDGDLVAWRRDTCGRWWGEVRVRVQRGVAPGAGGMRHVWWVPAHAVTQKSRSGPSGGQ
ncbi:hypothetical protein E1181_25680 [Saccharopolyspora terrae]|uniref:Uncharacterized protein n=1 Tax=Saccharopolyspora terrae TaxID=2530384 RepID=A0A4R4VCN2_9PSEU|nr:hypothetical protein E1181_25680 [Saccharopolyspora terrae]